MTQETQEARIERLTQLAQEVWPQYAIYLSEEHNEVWLRDRATKCCVMVIDHPHALQGLEQALAMMQWHMVKASATAADVLPADDEDDENAAPTVRYDSNRPGPA